jgi:hypothetical protein
MIRTLFATATLAVGLAGQASAVTTVAVDDFNQFNQFVWNAGFPYPTTETSAAMSNSLTRTVTHTYTGAPVQAAKELSWLVAGPGNDGWLSMVNDGSASSTGTVSWALPTAFISGTGVASLKFDVLNSDLGGMATLMLGATELGVQNYSGPGVVSFTLGANQSVINASGGTLALVFSGPANYDMTIDNVRFEVSPVPESSTALMMLAGLLAAAGLRRRTLQR